MPVEGVQPKQPEQPATNAANPPQPSDQMTPTKVALIALAILTVGVAVGAGGFFVAAMVMEASFTASVITGILSGSVATLALAALAVRSCNSTSASANEETNADNDGVKKPVAKMTTQELSRALASIQAQITTENTDYSNLSTGKVVPSDIQKNHFARTDKLTTEKNVLEAEIAKRRDEKAKQKKNEHAQKPQKPAPALVKAEDISKLDSNKRGSEASGDVKKIKAARDQDAAAQADAAKKETERNDFLAGRKASAAATRSAGVTPATSAVKPADPVVKPTDAAKPADPAVKPADAAKPADPVVKPTDAAKPADPAVKPADAAKPADPVVKPTDAAKPADPAVKPADAAKPADPVVKPTDAAKPADPAVKPADAAKPADPVVKPTDAAKPADPVVKPADAAKPADSTVKPVDATQSEKDKAA